MDFTPLEKAVLDMIIGLNPEISDALKKQLKAARVTARENSGGGFYTYIEIPADTPAATAKSPIGDVTAWIEGMDYGLGFILFLKEGRMDFLEGYSFSPESTATLDPYRLTFTLEPTRFA